MARSSAIDFTQLGHRKCFGTKQKTESELEISVFYLVPKHFRCPNWVKSISHDPAHNLPKNLFGNTLVHIPLI